MQRNGSPSATSCIGGIMVAMAVACKRSKKVPFGKNPFLLVHFKSRQTDTNSYTTILFQYFIDIIISNGRTMDLVVRSCCFWYLSSSCLLL